MVASSNTCRRVRTSSSAEKPQCDVVQSLALRPSQGETLAPNAFESRLGDCPAISGLAATSKWHLAGVKGRQLINRDQIFRIATPGPTELGL